MSLQDIKNKAQETGEKLNIILSSLNRHRSKIRDDEQVSILYGRDLRILREAFSDVVEMVSLCTETEKSQKEGARIIQELRKKCEQVKEEYPGYIAYEPPEEPL